MTDTRIAVSVTRGKGVHQAVGDHLGRSPTKETPMSHANAHPVARKRRHVFRWFFLAVQALFLLWIITGASSAAHTSCNGLSAQACTTAKQVGGGVGVLVIIFVWVAVDVVLGLTWLIFRRRP